MRLRTSVLSLALGVALTSCHAASTTLPKGPTRIALTMTEYSFAHPAAVPRGRAVIRFHNAGRVAHRFVLIPLPAGFPPIREQLRRPERAVVSPLAGVVDQPPDASGAMAVELLPGRYGLVCYAVDRGDGQSHALKGMASEIRVR